MCSTAYLFLLASSIKYANADTTTLTVSCSARAADSCEALAAGADPSGPYASGSYSNGVLDASGFWTFDVEGSVGSQAEGSVEALTLAAFSSGVVEGALSCNEIEQFSHNVLVSDFGHGPNAGPNAELLQFIEDNDAWVRGMVDANAAEDDYWLAVGQLMAQMDGILVGLHSNFSSCSASSSNLTRLDLLLVNLDGDLFDLQSAYPGSSSTSTSTSTRLRPQRGFAMASSQQELRCSALFKILDDRSDVFFGHSTWDTYATAAPRIFKNVRVPVRRGGETLQHVDSFSSSPGFIASIDDYCESLEQSPQSASTSSCALPSSFFFSPLLCFDRCPRRHECAGGHRDVVWGAEPVCVRLFDPAERPVLAAHHGVKHARHGR